jgi:hypothetical protein
MNKNEVIVKEAILGRYLSYLDDSSNTLKKLRSNPTAKRVEVQSMFNLIRMYLDKAEKELS